VCIINNSVYFFGCFLSFALLLSFYSFYRFYFYFYIKNFFFIRVVPSSIRGTFVAWDDDDVGVVVVFVVVGAVCCSPKIRIARHPPAAAAAMIDYLRLVTRFFFLYIFVVITRFMTSFFRLPYGFKFSPICRSGGSTRYRYLII
jgi:hypothetical protein